MATKVEQKMPNGDTEIVYKLEGMTFKANMVEKMMAAKDVDLQMKWIKETPIRDDDVILCAYPKTGTHWTWEIINMVQRGTAEYQKDTKEVAMLEFTSPETTASMTSPRVLNAHLTHSLIPDGIKEKKCKILHVMRNPKDVVVSLYFHIKNMNMSKCPPFDMFAKIFRGAIGEPHLCSYLWYIKQWEQFQADNPDYPLLNVFYEDMKKDPVGETKKIAKFLGKDLDEATVEEISTKCNFQNMKQAQSQKNDVTKERVKKEGSSFMYRKGGIGDWRNHFTVAENKEFDKWIETELKDSKIKFQYE